MRRISLTLRRAHDAQNTDAVECALIQVEHPALDAPLRFSTDPTERLSDAPLRYGTRSRWNGADPATQPYVFAEAAVELPGDLQGSAGGMRLAVAPPDSAAVEILRSFTRPATLHLAVVLATSPDIIEAEWRDYRISDIERAAEDGLLVLTAGRMAIEDEGFPAARYTRGRFPGLFP